MQWRRRHRAVRGVGGILVVALVGATLAGCDRQGATLANPSPTVRTEPPQSTTTTTDPYAIPDLIDEAYVSRILTGLDAVMSDVTRLVVETRSLPREAADRLKAIYGTELLLNNRLDSISRGLARGLPGHLPVTGQQLTVLEAVLSAAPDCIYARINRDYSQMITSTELNGKPQWVAIRPLDLLRDPYRYNRVGWAYYYEGYQLGFEPPRTDPCSGS